MALSSEASTEDIVQLIATKLNTTLSQVTKTLDLLNEGNTVPFIARYRKEKTGSLDETQIRSIEKEYQEQEQLIKEKKRVKERLTTQGQLTDELLASIDGSYTKTELKEIYRPYKQKKKTKGTLAREQGLEPLAQLILGKKEWPEEKTLHDVVLTYINSEMGVEAEENALEGARNIIAEDLSNSPLIRELIREEFFPKTLFKTTKSLLYTMDEEEDDNSSKVIEGKKYEQYFEFEESALTIRPHRLLAMRRGDNEGILKFKVVFPDEDVVNAILNEVLSSSQVFEELNHQIELAITDCWKRLLGPSMQREIKRVHLEKAEKHSIEVFGENLKNLLLTPPMKSRILGIDPAFRTGCKYAAIDEMGTVLKTGTIYPTKPHEQYEGAAHELREVIRIHDISLIAIGNGTASRETEEFISKYVAKGTDLKYAIVNEAGASVYSASEIAKTEFPNIDVSIRGAISIARRFKDPMSELVKIDPRSIGVGQYQHDLTGLSRALKDVVIDTVNMVGVDVNTASEELLKYVSGITRTTAKNIISYRSENGAFVYRDDLKSVPGIGEKTFEQSAGFLRIPDAPDPFDNSPIHPESYELAEKIIDFAKFTKNDLIELNTRNRLQKQLKMVNPAFIAKKLKQEDLILTISDLIYILQNPYRDPREDFDKPLLKSSLLSIEDLEIGSRVEGTITNVTDFGCFVDIGVKTNGLIHISEISESFIRHPREAGLKVGDIVKPLVKEIDTVKKRISLTLKKKSVELKDKKKPKQTSKPRGKQVQKTQDRKKVGKKKPQSFEDKTLENLFKNGKISL